MYCNKPLWHWPLILKYIVVFISSQVTIIQLNMPDDCRSKRSLDILQKYVVDGLSYILTYRPSHGQVQSNNPWWVWGINGITPNTEIKFKSVRYPKNGVHVKRYVNYVIRMHSIFFWQTSNFSWMLHQLTWLPDQHILMMLWQMDLRFDYEIFQVYNCMTK